MLMVNDKLPATYTKTFQTRDENQELVDLNIYESRSTDALMEVGDKKPITTIHMKFNAVVPKETPVVVTMALDNSGLLHIMAEEKCMFTKLDTTFQLSNQMSMDEMKTAEERMKAANVE
jgi:molecular chaperone DnaK (HSP70)